MPFTIEGKASRTVLSAGFAALGLRLQEAAADELPASHVASRLRDAVEAAHRGSGTYAYYLDHIGDGSDGDVVYNCGGDTYTAPYEIQGGGEGTAATARVDTESRTKVQPRVTYEPVADDEDGDGYAQMYEAWKRDLVYTEVPLYERFVSKAERDSADEGDFAGKGKSFPVLKPADVMPAVRSMGRAGSGNYGPAALKARIITIAKRKGWTKYLPKAWRGDDAAKEGARLASATSSEVRVVESSSFAVDVALREAFKPGYQIKLISPGKGSTAFYTEEVLRRDGPKVFKAGTPMRIDHPTAAEEAARPEGSVRDWGAVLAKDAVYLENHKDGPGLFSEVKPFSDHATTIAEKGPYAGVSIAAWGEPLRTNGQVVMREGVPVLASLTRADGVDMVTRAGAGGMFLSEAARASSQQGVEMNEQEQRQLAEALRTNALLLRESLRSKAITEGASVLKDVSLPAAIKTVIVENVLERALPTTATGELDAVKLAESLMAEARRIGAAYAAATGSGAVVGLGVAATPAAPTATEIAAREAAQKADEQRYREAFASLMPGAPANAIELALKGRAA